MSRVAFKNQDYGEVLKYCRFVASEGRMADLSMVRRAWAGAFDPCESKEARAECSAQLRESFRHFVSIGGHELIKQGNNNEWLFELPLENIKTALLSKQKNDLLRLRKEEVVLGVVMVSGMAVGTMVYEKMTRLRMEPVEFVMIGCCRSYSPQTTRFGDGTFMKPGELYISEEDTARLQISAKSGRKLLIVDDKIDTGETMDAVENGMKRFGIEVYKTCGSTVKPYDHHGGAAAWYNKYGRNFIELTSFNSPHLDLPMLPEPPKKKFRFQGLMEGLLRREAAQ